VFDVADAEALSFLPAKGPASRQPTNNIPNGHAPHAKGPVVTNPPVTPSGSNRRINDVVIRHSPFERGRI
jgi:hypothetical protein